ncbi:MAG: ATP-dependent helicase, partial [bacterium]|nr:ATP-dependent helicase [bacterium]
MDSFIDKYKKVLNEEQIEVVKEGDGYCLVLAGAGTGKTRTLCYRVAYLIDKGVTPEEILLLTFTNKAAREMLSRVEQYLGYLVPGLVGGTFHHAGNLFLRKFGREIGIEPGFSILDEGDSKSLIRICLKESGLAENTNFPKADTVAAILSFSRNSQKEIDEVVRHAYSKFTDRIYEFEKIKILYKVKKAALNALDFDDLLCLWQRLLAEKPQVKDTISRQFKYVLVDEYQDTNKIQAEILRLISSVHRNLLVVGDDSQSIYSFRAAEVANILNFPKVYPETKIFRLTINYRSTPEILRLANKSIKKNRERLDKNLSTPNFSKKKPSLFIFRNLGEQAGFFGEQIEKLYRQKKNLSDTAVLFRANYQVLEFELELAKRNIPYIKRGGLRFFEQAHVKDIAAYFKILSRVCDEISWRRILELEEGIGEKTAGFIIEKIIRPVKDLKEISAGSAIDELPEKARASFRKIVGFLEKTQGNDSPGEMMGKIIEFYMPVLERNFVDGQERAEDLLQLVNFSKRFESSRLLLDEMALGEKFEKEGLK